MILRKCITKLMNHENLNIETCYQALDEVLSDKSSSLQVAAFLVLLQAKSLTDTELTAIIDHLRNKMITVKSQYRVLDIVGTGGDGANTINISTASAILAASCGVKIAKHGNRAVSSLAGSADVLEALGINIDLSTQKISQCIDQLGFGFCFSPNFHPALQQLKILRKELNVPTIINILGPLLNPAKAEHYILGVNNEDIMLKMAKVLQHTRAKHSLVIHGSGLDEISCIGPIKIIEIKDSNLKSYTIEAKDFGLPSCDILNLKGGNAQYNANIILDVFAGKNSTIANTFIFNAAVAMYLYGLYPSITDAIPHASENLRKGSALRLLKKLREFTHD